MNTQFLLLAMYEGIPIVPLHQVQRDFFNHLSLTKFLRKVSLGQINIPIVRLEQSKKTAKGVHIIDLAKYIDDRRAEALRELDQNIF